jgi:cobyrinic acid a,c-diamide synthase
VGKTTVSLGLMGALVKKGLVVQPFKAGPDFIDPSYHTWICGRASRNLDSYLLSRKKLVKIFARAAAKADISIIEGMMGLFDGLRNFRASTAEVARIIGAPVVLVADAWSTSTSLAAQLVGYRTIDRRLKVVGVILNKVANTAHRKACEEAIKRFAGLRTIGALPYDPSINLPERHLGLVPTREDARKEAMRDIVKLVWENVDLDAVIELATNASPLQYAADLGEPQIASKRINVAVAYDESFNFYYQDGLDELVRAGANLEFFSPTHDNDLPADTCGVYIGGGFPEFHAAQLAENSSMRNTIKKVGEQGLPILAECGGMMYLGDTLKSLDGTAFPMVKLFDFSVEMTQKLTLSYVLAESVERSLLLRRGGRVVGHEFHRSVVTQLASDTRFSYRLIRGTGFGNGLDGAVVHNVLATYMHTHFSSKPSMAAAFVTSAKRHSRR